MGADHNLLMPSSDVAVSSRSALATFGSSSAVLRASYSSCATRMAGRVLGDIAFAVRRLGVLEIGIHFLPFGLRLASDSRFME